MASAKFSRDKVILSLCKTIQSMKEELAVGDDDDVDEEERQLERKQAKLQEKISEAKSTVNWHWSPGKAFSVVSKARNEDEQKRKKLTKIYEKAEELVREECDERLLQQLKTHFSFDVSKEIPKKVLQQKNVEHIVLFAGEVSSGKSSLINLILGEDILPVGLQAVTPTVCEIRYGEKRKLEIYYKDSAEVKEIILSDPKDEKTYTEVLADYLDQKYNREEGSPYTKCVLFWPHELLKEGIVIVDSPGIGESDEMTTTVTNYLANAFCFVYVINSGNAGGVQTDRIVRLMEKVIEHQHRESGFLLECALFVCNKWDQVENDLAVKDDNLFKSEINRKLEKYWPNLDSSSQVITFSTKNAHLCQEAGYISEVFVTLMEALKLMMLKTIVARLKAEWNWLDCVLERILYYTKAVIRNVEREYSAENVSHLQNLLKQAEKKHFGKIEEIEKKIKTKTEDAVKKFSEHFNLKTVQKRFSTWGESECPVPKDNWQETEQRINLAIKQRFIKEIERFEAEENVIKQVRQSLLKRLSKYRQDIESCIQDVEDHIVDDTPITKKGTFQLTVGQKVLIGVTSPIWVPVAVVAGILYLPVVTVLAIKTSYETASEARAYNKSKSDYMGTRAINFLKSEIKENILFEFVTKQLIDVKRTADKLKAEFIQRIFANFLLLAVLKDKRSAFQNTETYLPIFRICSCIRGELASFAIEDVFESDVAKESLKINEGLLLGQGAFASVYQGQIKRQDGEMVDVAVKICRDVVNKNNAYNFLSEEKILRNLDHPNVVKFLGRTLQRDSDGARYVFLMELCTENLRTFLQHNPGSIPANAITDRNSVIKAMLKRASDVALGLKYIHGCGIVHRDLKPENILIGTDNVLKISDVGISKPIIEVTGTKTGTPLYMAPEVFASKPYGASADVYSYGLILWELWYGKRVFIDLAVSSEELCHKIKQGCRPDMDAPHPPQQDLRDLIEKCWSSSPKDRVNAEECVLTISSLLSFIDLQDMHIEQVVVVME